ncbi:hypothetical protein [Nonomuraea africana]|uniref:Uncharacterized protein n=1 Tax=Nonomuraea africana TaxID=46171 RepID=A0ABR9KD42_9ACTN|nr:hypothetical protein [Nonomuraea africana]MBE1559927.1 hypothetical protein [Nonomuraea africana]
MKAAAILVEEPRPEGFAGQLPARDTWMPVGPSMRERMQVRL